MRLLTPFEHRQIQALTEEGIDAALIEPTKTGLKKSILDATEPVRHFLKKNDIHDYDMQGLGAAEHKVIIDCWFLTEQERIPTKASLYRPTTKSGDPRIWFTGLAQYCNPNDVLAIVTCGHELMLVNVSKYDLVLLLNSPIQNPIQEILKQLSDNADSTARELLMKLRAIVRNGPTRSVTGRNEDTAIGRTLETALGIKINSNPKPDYKGIELKSFRRNASRQNRKTLFAQVPNWQLSLLKSSKEILDAYGYERDGVRKLYCTVSTIGPNSQGLSLSLDANNGFLNELSSEKPPTGKFATWVLNDLRRKLVEKHAETFWVSANVRNIDGIAHFEFLDALHTRKPLPTQLDFLISQGKITVDHLIKTNAKGRTSEKGPLFKIEENALPLIFPTPKLYSLA